jgi:hypothetical protein
MQFYYSIQSVLCPYHRFYNISDIEFPERFEPELNLLISSISAIGNGTDEPNCAAIIDRISNRKLVQYNLL